MASLVYVYESITNQLKIAIVLVKIAIAMHLKITLQRLCKIDFMKNERHRNGFCISFSSHVSLNHNFDPVLAAGLYTQLTVACLWSCWSDTHEQTTLNSLIVAKLFYYLLLYEQM